NIATTHRSYCSLLTASIVRRRPDAILLNLALDPLQCSSAARSCKTTRRFVWHHDFVLMIGGAAMDVTLNIFQVAPGHDSWVIGDEPYVSLHLMGAGTYTK